MKLFRVSVFYQTAVSALWKYSHWIPTWNTPTSYIKNVHIAIYFWKIIPFIPFSLHFLIRNIHNNSIKSMLFIYFAMLRKSLSVKKVQITKFYPLNKKSYKTFPINVFCKSPPFHLSHPNDRPLLFCTKFLHYFNRSDFPIKQELPFPPFSKKYKNTCGTKSTVLAKLFLWFH